MCNRMQRQFERYAQENLDNPRNFEYHINRNVFVKECFKNEEGRYKLYDRYDDECRNLTEKQLHYAFCKVSDHHHYGSKFKATDVIFILQRPEMEKIKQRLNETTTSAAMRTHLVANFLRSRPGRVAKVLGRMVDRGLITQQIAEKVT